MMSINKLTILLVLAAMLFSAPRAALSWDKPVTIKCLSTTSTENSGLTDYLLPIFEAETGIKVMLIARGTGAALEGGKRGDADVVLVHAKTAELKMVNEGWFINRRDVMYNDFIILGPKSDPAGVSKSKSAKQAFGLIAAHNKTPFYSRGDNSGTHKKELSLWKSAAIAPSPKNKWYMETGQGMSKTVRVASEKAGYTIADRGTWISRKDAMHLVILFEGDKLLFNQYGIMAVNPAKHNHVKYKESTAFINWLTSSEGQDAIAKFKIKGNQLFIPNARGQK